jgi:Zn-dependent alcohol dehydrogenase
MLLDGTTRLHTHDGLDLKHYLTASTMSERMVFMEDSLIPVPDDVPDEVAAITGCAVATGVGTVVTSAGARPGSSAVVIGCGGIGLAMIQGAHLAGCDPIVAIDLEDGKLELAVRLGATNTVNARTESAVDAIERITGSGADFVFDSVGSSATVNQALELARPGGSAVVAGMHSARTEVSIPMGPLVMKAKTLMGAFGGSMKPRVDLPRLIDLYREGRLQTDRMVTQRYKLEELPQAFTDMQEGRGGRSVIVFDAEE